MNYVIVCQVKNVGNRIFDWIKYHAFIGFDTFIIFDDHSEDDTESEIYKASKIFNKLKIILSKTIIEPNSKIYSLEQCANSNLYANDNALDKRIQSSYTKGNNMVKNINPEAVCAFIDTDEFIFIKDNNIENVKTIFEKNNCVQILMFNFDIKDDYTLEKNFLFKNKFQRWSFNGVNEHPVWSTRCKPIFKSKSLDFCHWVHVLNVDGKTHDCRDYDILRMHHFRKPNLQNGDTIEFVDDEQLDDTLKLLKDF